MPAVAPGVRAILWEENPDLTALLRALCALASIDLTVVSSAETLLAAAARVCPGDLLCIDCSEARPTDLDRCLAILPEAAATILIFHPRPEMVQTLRGLARGTVIGMDSGLVGLAALEQLRVLVALGRGQVAAPALAALTHREQIVLRLVQAGLSNAQIAQQLGLCESTVKTHVANIRAKWGLDSRRALISAFRPQAGS